MATIELKITASDDAEWAALLAKIQTLGSDFTLLSTDANLRQAIVQATELIT